MIRLFSWKVSTNYVRSRHKPKKRLAFLFREKRIFHLVVVFGRKKLFLNRQVGQQKEENVSGTSAASLGGTETFLPSHNNFLGGIIVISWLWYRFLLCTLLSCYIYIAGSAATAGSAEIHRVRHVWSHQRGIQFPPSSVSQASLFSTTAIFLFFLYFPRPRKIEFPSLD